MDNDVHRTLMQRTLRRRVSESGIGLHTGRAVRLTLKPARAGTGVVFVRTDAPGRASIIPGHWRHVQSTELATGLGNRHGLGALTVEHLMAALRGCGIDNAVVMLDAAEMPVFDGSAAPLVDIILRAGSVEQAAPRRFIQVRKTVEIRCGEKFARLSPDSQPRFSVGIDFPCPAIGRQHYELNLDHGGFARELAPARTFGFLPQLEDLNARGLALGGSRHNAVLIHEDRVLNPEGLRFADEFVRHKLLDSVGDLYLAGAPVLGHFQAWKPGHAMNVALLGALFADQDAWRFVSGDAIPARDENLAG